MVDFKITKIEKIKEICNSSCWNFYYVYYGRIYNEQKTKYKKFKYIFWFDIFDVLEFYEKDSVKKEEIKDYAKQLENIYLLNIENFNDEKHLQEFYNYCNETIENFNKIYNI